MKNNAKNPGRPGFLVVAAAVGALLAGLCGAERLFAQAPSPARPVVQTPKGDAEITVAVAGGKKFAACTVYAREQVFKVASTAEKSLAREPPRERADRLHRRRADRLGRVRRALRRRRGGHPRGGGDDEGHGDHRTDREHRLLLPGVPPDEGGEGPARADHSRCPPFRQGDPAEIPRDRPRPERRGRAASQGRESPRTFRSCSKSGSCRWPARKSKNSSTPARAVTRRTP